MTSQEPEGKGTVQVFRTLFSPCGLTLLRLTGSGRTLLRGCHNGSEQLLVARGDTAFALGNLLVLRLEPRGKNRLPRENYEAGALSKAIDKSRVSPFLFAVSEADLADSPLLQLRSG